MHAPCPGAIAAPDGDVDPGERADVDQIDIVAVGGDVDAGQVFDARAALAGAIAVGVLQNGHQGECISVAHYRAGRAPGTAAGGGHQLVRQALRSWLGPCMRLALTQPRYPLGDVDPGKGCRRRSAVLRPWPATLPLARCSMRARRWPARSSARAHQVQLQVVPPAGAPCAPVLPRMSLAPGFGAVAALARRQRAFYMATEMTCIEVIRDLRKVMRNHF